MGSRRSKGEGTLYQRKSDKRWYGQITLPSGKRKGFYGKEKAEVKRRMKEAQTAIAKGIALPDESQSVAEYVQHWLDMTTRIRPSTKQRYRYDVRRIVAYFGEQPLSKLKAQHIQMFYAACLKEVGSTSVHHIHGVVHHALQDAVRLSLVERNEADLVDAPSVAHVEMKTLSEDQARELLVAVQGHRFEMLYLLALRTGMRRGELLALKWQDVDLKRGMISVRANVQRVDLPGERLRIDDTKTDNSHRQVKIKQSTIDALKAHQQQQRFAMQRFAEWHEQKLVFTGPTGKVISPELPGRILHRILQDAQLPDIRFHDLRHTAVTILLARGVPPHTVAKMIGDDVGLMLKVYAHVTPSMMDDAAEVMDVVFGG
jgi:integrase